MTLREKLREISKSAPTGVNYSQLAAQSGVRYNILYSYVVGIRETIPAEDERKIRDALAKSAQTIQG